MNDKLYKCYYAKCKSNNQLPVPYKQFVRLYKKNGNTLKGLVKETNVHPINYDHVKWI